VTFVGDVAFVTDGLVLGGGGFGGPPDLEEEDMISF